MGFVLPLNARIYFSALGADVPIRSQCRTTSPFLVEIHPRSPYLGNLPEVGG
jgi:hypothetical protein